MPLSRFVQLFMLFPVFGTSNSAVSVISGTGTNLKVGAHFRCKAPEKNFCYARHFFGSTSTISRFGGCAEIAIPDIARPDKTAPDQTARLNNGGHEQSSP